MISGSKILATSLKRYGVEAIFFIMGGPMGDTENHCEEMGIRMIGVRHEQAAAMMATAYARLRRTPSVCIACSGPGTTNLVTGVANAWADGAPVVAIGGSSPIGETATGAFQEMDQVAMMKPITRWAERCYDPRRIPEMVDKGFRIAMGAHPGPVYLDLPRDVIFAEVPEEQVRWMEPPAQRTRPMGDPAAIERAVELLSRAERPVLISGSGVIWSEAEVALRTFVERSGIPFWTTPQGRGVIPEDHALSFLASRSAGFRDCDAIVQVATRQNYVIGFAKPPRWSAGATLIQIDADADEIGRNRRPDVGIVGDARAVLEQLTGALGNRVTPDRYRGWVDRLRTSSQKKIAAAETKELSSDARPIHPLRLCREIRDWLPRDAVLAVDGAEILNFARQSIPFYTPRSLNSGPFGSMGTGLPLGLGAQVALPDATVVVLHGDGSFGMNGMELDTALRHKLPVICVISNNGGWTGRNKYKAGRDLGFTRYDLMFGAIGVKSWFVEDPKDIRPALDAALAAKAPAIINVITEPQARAAGGDSASQDT